MAEITLLDSDGSVFVANDLLYANTLVSDDITNGQIVNTKLLSAALSDITGSFNTDRDQYSTLVGRKSFTLYNFGSQGTASVANEGESWRD